MSLTRVTHWKMKVSDMCDTTAGGIAVRMGYVDGSWSPEIRMCDRRGGNVTTYNNMCDCFISYKYISELIAGQYLAASCGRCNTVKVVDTRTHEVVSVYTPVYIHQCIYTGCELWAMCTAGEGSLLIWDNNSQSVIQLKFNEQRKELYEVRRVKLTGDYVLCMCYMPHTDLLILSRGGYNGVVQAVKLHGDAGQPPVWQLEGKVLGKKIDPAGVSCDSEGRVYVADGPNRRVLLLNGYTGEVIQQLLQDAGLERVLRVCCLSDPHQLLVYHNPPPHHNSPTLSLFNISSL